MEALMIFWIVVYLVCAATSLGHLVVLKERGGLPWWLSVKNLPEMQQTWVQSLGREDPLEEGMATHSNILA